MLSPRSSCVRPDYAAGEWRGWQRHDRVRTERTDVPHFTRLLTAMDERQPPQSLKLLLRQSRPRPLHHGPL